MTFRLLAREIKKKKKKRLILFILETMCTGEQGSKHESEEEG